MYHRFIQQRGFASFAVRSAIEAQAVKWPTRNALRVAHQGVRWTFAQLREHTDAVGSGFLDLGVKSVAVSLGNNVEHIAIQLGAANAGIKVVDAPNITKEGLTKLLKEQKCSALVVSPEDMGIVYEAIPGLRDIPMTQSSPLSLEEFPDLRMVCQTGRDEIKGTFRFRDMLLYSPHPDRLGKVEVGPEGDAPFLVSVDGSSGAVKGELTQKQVLESSKTKSDALKLDASSRVLFKAKTDMPVNLAVGTLACVMNASQLVVPSESFDEAACAAADANDQCTASFA